MKRNRQFSKSNERNTSSSRDKALSVGNVNKMNSEIMSLSKELEELGDLIMNLFIRRRN